jgi:hypothetical protein
MNLVVIAKTTSVFFETLIAITQSRSQCNGLRDVAVRTVSFSELI